VVEGAEEVTRVRQVVGVALNGSRNRDEHPGIPQTPSELADAARLSVAAGAAVLHLHVYDDEGRETFAAGPTARALQAVRGVCPGVPISLTTSEGIEAEPSERLRLISEWTDLPELVTANMGEAEIAELCHYLSQRGVAIEAGLLSTSDAEAFVRSGLAELCERVLIEPLDAVAKEATQHAAAIEEVVERAGISLRQMHHGDGRASWSVNRRGAERGHDIRTGLEDTVVLPDGTIATDNAELVRAAAELIREVADSRNAQ
jgi:uncharacterized protein (DUF849 family)